MLAKVNIGRLKEFALVLLPEKSPDRPIGRKNDCRLGWTSWLGCEKADGVVTLGSKIH